MAFITTTESDRVNGRDFRARRTITQVPAAQEESVQTTEAPYTLTTPSSSLKIMQEIASSFGLTITVLSKFQGNADISFTCIDASRLPAFWEEVKKREIRQG